MLHVVFLEESKTALGFEIGPRQQNIWHSPNVYVTDMQSSCSHRRTPFRGSPLLWRKYPSPSKARGRKRLHARARRERGGTTIVHLPVGGDGVSLYTLWWEESHVSPWTCSVSTDVAPQNKVLLLARDCRLARRVASSSSDGHHGHSP